MRMPLYKLGEFLSFAMPSKVGRVRNHCLHTIYTSASAQDLQGGSKEQQLVKGLNGACKMLGKIASKPQNLEAIAKAGGLDALCQAFKSAGGE